MALLQALVAGTQKHFPSGSFTLGNVAYTTASLVQLFTGLITAIQALNTAQANAKDALAAKESQVVAVGPVLKAYKQYLLSQFAGATQTLADFGLAPPKERASRTSEENAAAAAKAEATRKARGTVGPKKKLAIQGNVTGVTVTPITSPAPQSPSVQPAPVAPVAAASPEVVAPKPTVAS